MSKIYCKNCRWSNFTWINRCLSIGDLESKPSEVYTQEEIQESANGDNDCPGYQRKWWKFWVVQ